MFSNTPEDRSKAVPKDALVRDLYLYSGGCRISGRGGLITIFTSGGGYWRVPGGHEQQTEETQSVPCQHAASMA